MSEPKIPHEQLLILDKLTNLDDSIIEEFNNILDNSKPTLGIQSFCKKISSNVKSIRPIDAEEIMNVLCGLSYIMGREDFTISNLMDVIINSISTEQSKDFSFFNSKRPVLQKRLEKLLSHEETLGIIVKAIDVLSQYERTICEVKILSDIRSVFNNSGDHIVAGTIIHNLHLCFHQNNEHKDFYVALDSDDLKKLKEIIIRAEKKENYLKTIFKKTKIPYLEVE